MGKEKNREQMILANWGKGKRFSFRKKFNWFSNVLEIACNSFRIFFFGGGKGWEGWGTGGVYNGIHNDSVVIMSKCGCLTALFDVEKKQ